MPSISQQNFETIVVDFVGALARGDVGAASSLLDPDVIWHGLRKDLLCRGREEVLETFRWALEERRDTDALEFIRGEDRIAMGARGPAMIEVGGEPLDGQIYNVFTLNEGRITRIDDYRLRSEALAALGATAEVGWR
jgi:ketosteroid isomerase-like protein